MRIPVVLFERGRMLVDRRSLAELTGRSVHTIRLRCPQAGYRDGIAVYDAEFCEQLLGEIPQRQRSELRDVG